MSNPHFRAGTRVRLYEAEISPSIAAARFGLDPATIDDFSLNVNPFGPPASAVAAARAALDRCNAYPDTRLSALRETLARRHEVDDDRILFGAGLDDVIKLVLHAWTSEGDRVLVHVPTFPRYELEARLHGCRIVAVPSDPPWTIEIAGIRAALAAQAIDVAFLCTPNNPTGATIANEDIAAFARRFRDTVFVVDEALGDPRDEGATALARSEPNVVVLRTFSKAFGLAGLRIGYALGPVALISLVEQGRPPFNVAMPAEAAALAALDDEPFLARTYETFDGEAARFAKALESSSRFALRARHANMALIEDLSGNGARCVDALAAQGLLVADAACFGGLDGRSVFRVSLRDPAANARLLDALMRIS